MTTVLFPMNNIRHKSCKFISCKLLIWFYGVDIMKKKPLHCIQVSKNTQTTIYTLHIDTRGLNNHRAILCYIVTGHTYNAASRFLCWWDSCSKMAQSQRRATCWETNCITFTIHSNIWPNVTVFLETPRTHLSLITVSGLWSLFLDVNSSTGSILPTDPDW